MTQPYTQKQTIEKNCMHKGRSIVATQALHFLKNISIIFTLSLFAMLHAGAGNMVGTTGLQQQLLPQPAKLILLAGQSATQLANGCWLLLGGVDNIAAIHDPKTGQNQLLAGHLKQARSYHTATLLPDGKVLVIGGVDASGNVISILEQYDPDSDKFNSLANPGLIARSGHTATLMADGKLLIAGGADSRQRLLYEAELYNPRNQSLERFNVKLDTARRDHVATLLPTAQLLLFNGLDSSLQPLGNGELFDQQSQRFSLVQKERVQQIVNAMQSTVAPAIKDSQPAPDAQAVPVDQSLVIRFAQRMQVSSLNSDNVTLMGPHGVVPIKVVAAEYGVLLFVTPQQDLLPASRYTLFVKGALDHAEQALPFSAIGFETAQFDKAQVSSGNGNALAIAGNNSVTQNAITQTLPGKDSATSIPAQINPAPEATASTAANATVTTLSTIEKNALALANSSTQPEVWHPDARHFKGDWRARRGDSPLQALPALQAAKGETALAGQVLTLNGHGLANVTISVGQQSTRTDITGRFLLNNLQAGEQVLDIDGQTVQKSGTRYGFYQTRVNLSVGKTTALTYPIWSSALDPAGNISVASPTKQETVVSSPRIPGLELRIPAGTVIRDRNGKIVTELNITAIPVDHPPFPLPSLGVPVYFTIQPGGAILSSINGKDQPGARLIYPNFGGAEPGTRMNFWNYDARGKGWYVYGLGSVSADAKQIIPDPGVAIYEFTGAMVADPSAAPAEGPVVNGCRCGDPVDMFTGLFLNESTDLQVNDVIPLSVARSYRQRDTGSRAFGIGTNMSYDIFLVGSISPWTYQDLVLPDGSKLRFTRTSAGTNYSDAVYQHNSSQGPFNGAILSWNGDGWDMKLKDGSVLKFPEAMYATAARKGAMIGIRDRYNNKLTLTRDSNSNLIKITSPSARYIQFTYDGYNRITLATDNLGRSVKYDYDTTGHLIKVTYPDQTFEAFTYDTKHNMLTVQDRRGKLMVTNVYDANNRITKQTYADNSTNLFAYALDGNGKGTQTDHTDGNSVVTRFIFNANGHATSVIKALGQPEQQTTSFERDPATNLLLSSTDALGRKTSYTYDSKGNQLSQTYLPGTADAVTSSATYSSDYNQVTSITDALNQTTTFTYDSLGKLQQIKDAQNKVLQFGTNAAGQLTQFTDARNKTTQFGYDGYDLSSITDPLNRSVILRTDAIGRTVSSTDPLNQRSISNIDNLDRVTSVIDTNNQSTGFGYDNNDNLTTVTDANSHSTQFAYDNRNAVTGKTDALNQSDSIVYDNKHRITQSTDRKNQVTKHTYDSLDRIIKTTFADTSSITRSYDTGNRVTLLADSINGNISFVYDPLDRITQVTSPKGTVNYTYDANGQRSTMTIAGQPTQSYTYDKIGRLTRIDQAAGAINNNQAQNIQFVYDDAGRLTKTTYANGITRDNSYDDAGQLTSITYKKADNSLIGDLTYTYDANGRRTKTSGSLAKTDLPDTISTASYDANNRLATWGSQILNYDANGNLTSDGLKTYIWNARNQLIQIKDSTGTEVASFSYDALGRRQNKIINGVSTGFIYDGVNIVQELSGTNVTNSYISAGVDQVFVQQSGTGPSASSLTYLTDALGSTIRLTNTAGDKVVDYSYDPYGNTRADAVINNSFQYTGRENDGTGLYYYRARYYSPATHRFISEDPIGLAGGINGYGYVGGNPVSRIDPLGLSWLDNQGRNPSWWSPGNHNPGGACATAECAAGILPNPAPINAIPSGNLSMSIPLAKIAGIPVGINISVKIPEQGQNTCYVGVGLVTSPNFSWAPRISPQYSVSNGDTGGWVGKISGTSSSIPGGPVGATGSYTFGPNGSSLSVGPTVTGSTPSLSVTGGYNFKF